MEQYFTCRTLNNLRDKCWIRIDQHISGCSRIVIRRLVQSALLTLFVFHPISFRTMNENTVCRHTHNRSFLYALLLDKHTHEIAEKTAEIIFISGQNDL